MFKAELKQTYETSYKIRCIRNGIIEKTYETHNVICLPLLYKASFGNVNFWRYLRFGSGSGTPSASDTALFTPLWNNYNFALEEKSVDYTEDSITWHSYTEVPANQTYVGTISEVGIWSYSYVGTTATDRMITHALIYDAEGMPITIEKDDLMLLQVEVTVTLKFSTISPWKIVNPKVNFIRLLDYLKTRLSTSDNNKNYIQDCVPLVLLTATPERECWGYVYVGSWPSSQRYLSNALPPFGLGAAPTGSVASLVTPRVVTAATRLETDATAYPVYFNHVAFMHACYAKLPDENVFAYYDIEDIPIGVGDGETKEFSNPLNYFVKNSETVYVNGTPLVRGVDYTIDNAPNMDMLQELTPCAYASFEGSNTTSSSYLPLFRRALSNKSSLPLFISEGVAGEYITKDTPLIIDMKEAVKLNTIHMPNVTGTMTLAKSDDKINWEDVISWTNNSGVQTFDETTARYWRISYTTTYYISSPSVYDNPAANAFLGYVGDPLIRFTNAPAADAEIKMKVKMDRPFKNAHFVIDIQGDLSISI